MKSRTDLKAYFETGDIPTEGEFEELIDSARHSFEDVDYTFKGVATSATTPIEGTANIMYLASTAGTYTNFNNVVVLPGELAALLWTINPSTLVGAWTKVSIITPVDATTYSTTVEITHAEILTLFSNKILAIASPGVGKAINVIGGYLQNIGIAGTWTPYTTNEVSGIVVRGVIDTADIYSFYCPQRLDYTVKDSVYRISPGGSPIDTDDQQMISNKGMYITINGSNPTGGGATGQTIKVNILYQIVDL